MLDPGSNGEVDMQLPPLVIDFQVGIGGVINAQSCFYLASVIDPLIFTSFVLGFQLMSFAASGFHVKYLEVYENSNYTRDNWVRYITTAGSYEIQMASPGPA